MADRRQDRVRPVPEPNVDFPDPEPEPETPSEGVAESPNLIVSLELLENGDVGVTLNREAARLGDILTAFELGRINVVRMYYESLDRDEAEGV